MNASHIAAIAGVSSALLIAAIASIPSPSDPITVERFDDTWRDTMVPLALTSTPGPKPVRVIPIAPDTSPAPLPPLPPLPPLQTNAGEPVTSEVTPRPRSSRTRETPPRDICRGKGKRYLNKYKWRCRR
jgi:hypothetical protein